MDLIYTDANRIDQGVLAAYALDLSFGEDEAENNFEITLGKSEPALAYGAVIYFEGTEYGGMVDFARVATDEKTITYGGRTWHGLINSKIIEPDSGVDYLVVSGDANRVLATLVNRLGLSALFIVPDADAGITISSYQFERYIKGYDGIRKMLAANGAKLHMRWDDRKLKLSAVPVVNYTDAPIDGDIAVLDIEQYGKKVNHLICLGSGELKDRQILHLYVDQFGRIGETQYYTGIDEITETYDYSSVETLEELKTEGIKNFGELRSVDVIEMSIPEDTDLSFDIGDIVGAVDAEKTGLSVSAVIAQKIIRADKGRITVEYETGEAYVNN